MPTYPYCRLDYWKENGDSVSACSGDDDWDFASVWPAMTSGGGPGDFRFTQDETWRLGLFLRMLKKAYEAGKRDKLKEVQSALGIPFSR